MSVWRQLTRGLRSLFHRRSTDHDIAEEVESFLDHETEALEARGLSPEEARRQVRLQMGTAAALREEVRSYGWENLVAGPLLDLRYAARRLRGKPGFTAASILTLALGIGASTGIFSVIESVLLKPLPYPESDRLVALWHTAPGIHIKDIPMAASLYFTYSEETRAFDDIALWQADTMSVTGIGDPEEIPALVVTNRFLACLRVAPILGRAFQPADDEPSGEPVAILSYGYWQSRFGGDRSAIGRRVTLDGSAYTIAGVLPPGFVFLNHPASVLVARRFNRARVGLVSFCCQGIARLKPGVTLEQAGADIVRMLPIAPTKFAINPGFSAHAFEDARLAPNLRLLKDLLVGDIAKTLWVLLGTVGIVLLIACANVANLLLVRADGRRQELAVRAALGAAWGRLARELLLESALLGVVGGALGLALAGAALRLLVASEFQHLPRLHEIAIDPVVLAFNVALSLAAGLLFGLIPVFKYARPRLSNGLRAEGRSLTQSRERHRARSLLVMVQVALALVLLVGSGLMIRTFQALRNVDPGFTAPHDVETVRISISSAQVKDSEAVVRMEEAILRKIETVAGVSAAAMVNALPTESGSNNPVYAEGQTMQNTVPPIRRFKFISPGYIAAIGSRLIAGRDLTWNETYRMTPVALVSESFAREVWHDPQSALGKRIRMTLKDDWREVVGVIADLRDDGVDQKAPAIVYWPLLQKNFGGSPIDEVRSVAFTIRTPRAGTSSLHQELQHAVGGVNPSLPLADVKTLESLYERSLARTSFTLVLLAAAGGAALLLGLIGIYGVISYSVAQRTREIGIRLALGAPLEDVTRLFLRYGLTLSAAGALCGLSAALLLTRLMKSLLFEVSPADPLTYAAAALSLIAAAALASYLPARRATGIDPVEALRSE